MYILAIETTGPVGSVAVIDAEKLSDGADAGVQNTLCAAGVDRNGAEAGALRVPMKVTTRAMSHLKNLIPMAAELLSEEGISKDEICAVAASIGPGSFTGIRIGVTTARALAQGWDVPCISVPTLELFREKCGDAQNGSDGSVCAIFNARRGQVYGACFGKSGEILVEPGPYMLSDVLDRIEEFGVSPVFYGDGVDAYFDKEEFRDRVAGYEAAPAEERYQTADMTARYALGVWNRSDSAEESAGQDDGSGVSAEPGHGRVVPYDEMLPDYMRESEAEQRLKDGSLEKMRKAKMEKFMKMAGVEKGRR